MMGAADGQATPNVCTCAITSCRTCKRIVFVINCLKLHLDDGHLPLLSSRLLEVDLVQLASHLLQLLVGDVETKLLRNILSIVPFLFIAVIFWQFCLKEKV